MVEETKAEPLADDGAAEDADEPWPVHEDTSEFEAILSPGAAASVREPSSRSRSTSRPRSSEPEAARGPRRPSAGLGGGRRALDRRLGDVRWASRLAVYELRSTRSSACCGSPGRRPQPASSAGTATPGRCASPPLPSDGKANDAVCGCSPTRSARAAARRRDRLRARVAGQDRRADGHRPDAGRRGARPRERCAKRDRSDVDRHERLPAAPGGGARAARQRGAVPPPGAPGSDGGRARRDLRRRRRRQPSRRHGDGHLRPRARPGARGGRAADRRADRRRARSGSRTARYGVCEVCGKPIGAGAAARDPVGDAAASTTRSVERAARRSEPAADVRVGSATNGLAPVSVAERSLARRRRGSGPGSRRSRLAAVVADQVTKHVVTRDARARRVGARGRAALDPPRAELRHRLRLLLGRDVDRHDRHRGRGRLDARLLRALGRAASGAPGRARPADRRQRLEPRRPGPARPRDRLHRLLVVARVQPRRQLHRGRRRDPARRAGRRRPRAAAAAPHARRRARDEAVGAAGAAGERLDRFLAAHLGSRGAAERAVEAGALVDGGARAKSYRLAGGEVVELPEPPRRRRSPPPPSRRRSSWEDEHLLVVDKPAGLVVHPGAGHAGGTLVDALRAGSPAAIRQRPGIVHRLDRDTSGLLVARALRGGASAADASSCAARALERTYLALVARPAALAARAASRRRSAATAATRRASRSTPTRRARRSRTSRSSGSGPSMRCCGSGSRPGGCTRSACTSPRSTCRSSATRSTASRDARLGRQFLHAAELALPASVRRASGSRRARSSRPTSPRTSQRLE